MRTYLLVLLLPAVVLTENSPKVCLEEPSSDGLDGGACFKGQWVTTNEGNRYASFQQIRYAQPPIGELRFKSPQPFHAAQGLWHVNTDSKVECSQLGMLDQKLKGEEDCLFLNIYVPDIAFDDHQTSLPVMVWIHGGALKIGSYRVDQYGPEQFMDRNVLAVSYTHLTLPTIYSV